MRLYAPIAKVDGEQRMVWGYASTEAQDEQGEVVTRDALAAALDEYMRFANIREMHQMSAVGVATEAAIDDRGLYLAARISDERAWVKVREGVYKGFSIGGRVKQRDPANRNVISSLSLSEISLVDRPANPEAVFDCWKAEPAFGSSILRQEPLQVWACGVPEHAHIAKAEATRCIEAQRSPDINSPIEGARGDAPNANIALSKLADLPAAEARSYADPGYQPDRGKRYPLDSEAHIRAAWAYIHKPRNAAKYTPDQVDAIKARIVAAWKEKIDRAGPPLAERNPASTASADAVRKGLDDVGLLAGLILQLDWLQEQLALEAAMEGDASPQPARLSAIVAELCVSLNELVAEETAALLQRDRDPNLAAMAESIVLASGASGPALAAKLHQIRHPRLALLGEQLAKIGLSHSDEALAKALAENEALLKAIGDMAPRLERLAQRVEEIAQTALPPLTMARGVSAIAKRDDRGDSPGPPENVVAALSRMSDDERTMALIKAAYARPIRPSPVAFGAGGRGASADP